jgi:hypothetical protein
MLVSKAFSLSLENDPAQAQNKKTGAEAPAANRQPS